MSYDIWIFLIFIDVCIMYLFYRIGFIQGWVSGFDESKDMYDPKLINKIDLILNKEKDNEGNC